MILNPVLALGVLATKNPALTCPTPASQLCVNAENWRMQYVLSYTAKYQLISDRISYIHTQDRVEIAAELRELQKARQLYHPSHETSASCIRKTSWEFWELVQVIK